MSFRLALVGHGSSIREIQEIVAETFENIETVCRSWTASSTQEASRIS